MSSLMPPRKKHWTPGSYQVGVFVRTPDGSVFEAVLNDVPEALAQAVSKPMLEHVRMDGKSSPR